jgi:hypothetical protein
MLVRRKPFLSLPPRSLLLLRFLSASTASALPLPADAQQLRCRCPALATAAPTLSSTDNGC